jgi:serine/threonine protein kinase
MDASMGPAEMARASASTDAAPITCGRFRLTTRIGVGGMAEVFRAVVSGPQGFERELVVKRILPRLSGSAEFRELFIREAKISALLSHPNIVQIYEFGEADGTYFIAMESVQGVTLRQALNELRRVERAIPFMVAADIARQVCTGLDYAHTMRGPDGRPLELVHQDISPTNIMLAYNGTVKILDFGIARAAAFTSGGGSGATPPVRGKVAYLAPEQAHKRPFDRRSDIFALGAVLHETLTGARLFPAKNDLERLKQMMAAPIQPPSYLNAAIPRELDRIVMRALAIDPAHRYQSAAAMAADLERTLIAARYSSRDLSKVLHGLFPAAGEPLVVVDDTPPEREPLAETPAVPGPPSPPPIPPTDRMLRVRVSSSVKLLRGALEAEKTRLVWARRRSYARLAAVTLAVVALLGAGALAFRHYLPRIKTTAQAWASPGARSAAPPPVLTAPVPTATAAAPTAPPKSPSKKRATKRKATDTSPARERSAP